MSFATSPATPDVFDPRGFRETKVAIDTERRLSPSSIIVWSTACVKLCFDEIGNGRFAGTRQAV